MALKIATCLYALINYVYIYGNAYTLNNTARLKTLNICVICDPMFDTYGPVTPALIIAKALAERKHKVSIVSTKISDNVQNSLKLASLNSIELNTSMFRKMEPPLSWFEAWAREAFFNLNSKNLHFQNSVVINFSHTIAIPSTIWYVQGPTTDALKDIEYELPLHYRFPYKFLKPLLAIVDNRLIKYMASISKSIIANSKFCASLYEKRGLRVHKVIYPPIDCSKFKPTSNPSADYVLTYVGKEIEFRVLKKIGDAGVKVKAFGSKTLYKPKKIFKNQNIEFFGKVSNEELANLYSNALFTFFPFTHEPFGYIPLESMACGTPVLSYNRQGPSETTINGVTGWLASTREEVIRLAVKLWKNGYSPTMRIKARRRALLFNVECIAEKWIQTIKECTC